MLSRICLFYCFRFHSLVSHFCLFFFYSDGLLRDLHSFPTRRSSDLTRRRSRPPFRRSFPPCPRTLRPIDSASRSGRSEEHTSELQSRQYLVCRLLLEKKKINHDKTHNGNTLL